MSPCMIPEYFIFVSKCLDHCCLVHHRAFTALDCLFGFVCCAPSAPSIHASNHHLTSTPRLHHTIPHRDHSFTSSIRSFQSLPPSRNSDCCPAKMVRRHRGRARAPNGGKTQPNNLYANLPEDDGDMNAHLTERFGRASVQDCTTKSGGSLPSAGPSRANNDICEYYSIANKPVQGGVWIDQPEFPDPSEILQPPENASTANGASSLIDLGNSLRPHKAEGPYASKDEYLGTTYELLREDTIRPLREAIEEFRKSPYDKDEGEYSNKGLGVYEPVYITSLVFSPRGLATRVVFSLGRVKKHIRWEQSKRLITGTLVALSPATDGFRNVCVLATVAARPLAALDQNPPEIDLFFARPQDQEVDPMKKWIMIECRSSFFEASRHTLLTLQHMMREPFPMSEHLVRAQSEISPPSYVTHNPHMSLSSLVSMEESANFENVNVLEQWPLSSSLSLDKSQSNALQRILTKKLAIVQGPPGTGKTYVSVQAVKVLRDNLRKEDAPIIITAQTNHAVDQILRHTMEFEPNFIRLGGRSKDAEVKKRTLFEVRSAMPPRKQPGSQRTQTMNAIRKLTAECMRLLQPLEANKPPVDQRVLLEYGLITKEQADSLEIDSRCTMGVSPADNPGILMEQWLGKSLAPCHRPSQPDDYGWGFEEEDFEVEQLQELEAEAVAKDDDDFENLRGEVILLSDNHVGKGMSKLTSSSDIHQILAMTSDLTTIHPQERGAIYNYFKREIKKAILSKMRSLAGEYSKLVLQRKVGQWEEDARILSGARIIGCTTTGLSKYRPLISALRPRVILVEEAAETMEAPVTAACMPSLEHLILVGDHLQLRPHTQVHDFEDEPYYLNLSLFERLVQNGVGLSTLTRQRRMIPEIRRLLKPIYHDVLKDHESVKDVTNRPPVESMGGLNSFFFCHEWPEARDANMSCYNEHEAKMIVGFVDYLVLNGVEPSKITLLTFYNGQRKRLVKLLREHKNLQVHPCFKVVTVDGYQGEENDIVLLSLVRSNKKHENAIGFLSNDNRACVALSRAKRGFYMFGNAELMARESDTWGEVLEIMYPKPKSNSSSKRKVGYYFPIQCSNHGRKCWVQEPEDWESIQGGCDLLCQGQLPCLHRCLFRCHPFAHDRVNCTQKCDRILICGHPCASICCDPCRCQMCDHRSKGVKSMLKATPTGLSSTPAESSGSLPVPSSASQMTPETSSSVTNQWYAFVNGGAATDDARIREMLKAEEADRMKDRQNANSEILIDLESGVESGNLGGPVGGAGTAKGKQKAQMVHDLI